MIKVLFLAANPAATTQLALDEEIRAIDGKIQGAKYRDNLELVSHWAVRSDDLSGLLMRHKPDVVHFSGHGSSAGELVVDPGNEPAGRDLVSAQAAGVPNPANPNGAPVQPVSIPAEALARLFGVLKDNVRVVFLNACYSEVQAQGIVASIDCAVGMSGPIRDDHAIAFAAEFYQGLAFGRSVRDAFQLGVVRLLGAGYAQAESLVRLHCRAGVDPAGIVLLTTPVQPLIPAAAPGPSPGQQAVREEIIRFNERFQQRQQEFRYLNANKELHDVLHQLQSFQPRILKFTEALRRAAAEVDLPDPMELADPLQDWVEKAKQCAASTDTPEQSLRWVARLDRAVTDLLAELTKRDLATVVSRTVDRAMEVLSNLPAQEQPRLNEKLVASALRLKTDELLASIEQVVKGLDAAGLGRGELRASFQAFGGLCGQLAGLIRDHNLCQEVDGALREAAGLTELTPQELYQWTDIKTWLEEIRSRHPDDPRAKRPIESTQLFEAAAASGDKKRTVQVFQRLMERFDDLFFHTDEALRETTRDLLTTVSLLDATLRGYIS
jgi:hypothetical protein